MTWACTGGGTSPRCEKPPKCIPGIRETSAPNAAERRATGARFGTERRAQTAECVRVSTAENRETMRDTARARPGAAAPRADSTLTSERCLIVVQNDMLYKP